MKIGISSVAFPDYWNLEKIFEFAKFAGFDGVEVALTETGEVNLYSNADDMQNVKTLAEKTEIELYSVASGLYWSYSLTSNDEKVRAYSKSIVKKQLEVASWLGCETILVVPGSVGVDFIPNCEIVEYDTAYERALAAINELKDYAEELKVSIAVENVWNKFLISPIEMRDFIDKFNSNYVGAYFDVGNVIYNGYPEHWIKILGERIKKVHFKDFRKSVGTLNGFVDLLSGDVDYPKVMEMFKNTGYDGWVTAETEVYKDYPEQSVINTANSMRRIVNV